jgi:hypothetical protein
MKAPKSGPVRHPTSTDSHARPSIRSDRGIQEPAFDAMTLVVAPGALRRRPLAARVGRIGLGVGCDG